MTKLKFNNILKEKFNLKEFRPLQEEIIENITNNRNTIGVIQTGSGKSLTYQLPALILDGLTIVISPLISLMEDQVDELTNVGIPSCSLNSMTENSDKPTILNKIYNGEIKIIFISPEKLIEQQFLKFILSRGVKVPLIVIDEAHCISSWGANFRNSYLELEKLKLEYKEIPILLLTATATKSVIKDLQEKFIVDDDSIFIGTFLKEKLSYNILHKEKDVKKQIQSILNKHLDQKGIVYCNTRKDVEKITKELQEEGYSANMYHAGLSLDFRDKIQKEYKNNELDIIVATTAFGMGVNIPNIRFVIHHTVPYSVENYYQETGRAARDGLDSDCYLLYSPKDVSKINFYINSSNDDSKSFYDFQKIVRLVVSNTCRKESILKHFNENQDLGNCGACDFCLSTPEFETLEESQDIINTIKSVIVQDCNEERSVGTVRDILLGSKVKKIREEYSSSDNYGKFKNKHSKELVEYYIYSLVIDDVIKIEERKTESYSWEVLTNNFINTESYKISKPRILKNH